MSFQPSSAEVLPSKHWHLSSLPQQRSFPVSIAVCPTSSVEELPVSIVVSPAFLSRGIFQQALTPVQPCSAESSSNIGICPTFLSRRALCRSSHPQQKSFPVSICVYPAFLSKRAPNRHWCLFSFPQQKSS